MCARIYIIYYFNNYKIFLHIISINIKRDKVVFRAKFINKEQVDENNKIFEKVQKYKIYHYLTKSMYN